MQLTPRSSSVPGRRPAIAAMLAAGLLLAACGDDGDSDRDAVIERLQGEGETPASAACYADELSDYSLGDIEALIDGESGNDELESAVAAAAEECADRTGE